MYFNSFRIQGVIDALLSPKNAHGNYDIGESDDEPSDNDEPSSDESDDDVSVDEADFNDSDQDDIIDCASKAGVL